jgi:methanogenic corrinoid protein MtbC1
VITEAAYNRYLSELLAGNRVECRKILEELLAAQVDIRDLYLSLFQRSLYQVGELWESNRISVATEHLATSITETLLTLVYPALFSAGHIGKKAIISCGVNEFHQVGGRIVADIFELNGWDSYFLGANTPARDLLQYIDEKQPDLLGMSLSIYFNLPALMETIVEVRTNFPQLDIIVGGQAFHWGGNEVLKDHARVIYVSSITELENLIRGN